MRHLAPSFVRAGRALRIAVAAATLPIAAAAAQESPIQVYGYFAGRLEKSIDVPSWDGATLHSESGPREFSRPFFNVMLQQQLSRRFKAYVNLNGAGASAIDVRNMWGEFSASNALNVRFGKVYRKFGLYNEVLDAVPTYYGIEPPESFDGDHLLLSRTTAAMVYGFVPVGPGKLQYAVSTDNGEGRTVESTMPLGVDLNYVFAGAYTLGVSGYTSGGATNSDIAPASGSPKSGVLPWMARDSFTVVNAYGEARWGALTVQAEWAQADHEAERDAAAVLTIVQRAELNARQRARFLVDPAGSTTDAANVRTRGDHQVRTWYVRVGRSFETRVGEVGPYLQWDAYSNPETIGEKRYGGDDEAGLADDGRFTKGTAGVVFRPVPQVAVKLDGSTHRYRLGGQRVSYPELRLDISYAFGL